MTGHGSSGWDPLGVTPDRHGGANVAIWARGERSRRQAVGIALLVAAVAAAVASVIGVGYAQAIAAVSEFFGGIALVLAGVGI